MELYKAVWAFVDAFNSNGRNVEVALCSMGASFGSLAENPGFRAAVDSIAGGESIAAVITYLSNWKFY